MPVLDQSVARQVGLDLSNMRTPSSISLMIANFDSSNSWLSLSFQMNGVPGLSDSRNGSIRSVAAKAYDTWLIRPNQERMSVMLLGVGKWRIASRYFLHHGGWLLRIFLPEARAQVCRAVFPIALDFPSQIIQIWRSLINF